MTLLNLNDFELHTNFRDTDLRDKELDNLNLSVFQWEQLKDFHQTHYHPSNSRYVKLKSHLNE